MLFCRKCVLNIELLNFQKFLCLVILLIANCNTSRKNNERTPGEDDSLFASCTINIWNTGEMKADDHPSILMTVQKGSDEKSTYHLPLFRINDRILQVEFKHKEKLIFICRSDILNVDEKIVECWNGNKIPETKTIEKCKTSEAKPELVDMQIPCGGSKYIEDSRLFVIGYEVFPKHSKERHIYGDTSEMTRQFFPFIQVCLDLKRKTTLYTSHIIDGRVIAARQILSFIPDTFSMEGYVTIHKKFTTEVDKVKSLKTTYIPQKQFHYLYKLFKDDLRNYFDNEDNNFVPRQLAPDYDMLLKNYKTLTHYYINTAPQWKIISCTWDALEELIRERASRRNTAVTIFTGTYKTLTLKDVKVFLSEEELSVPKYFWKIVLQKKKNNYAAIGFVTSNNPYDTEREPFCRSVCRQRGWPIDVKTPGLGKTVCCTVEEMLPKMKMKIPLPEIDSFDEYIDLSEVKEVLIMNG